MRDPEAKFFPKEKIQVFTEHESIESIKHDLDEKREKESMRLVNEMSQLAKAETN